MSAYILAYTLFLAAHSIPTRPPIRAWLVSRLSERGFLVAYSSLSLALLALLIATALDAPHIELWSAPSAIYHLALLFAPLGIVLVVMGLSRPNPVSISMASEFDTERPGLVALTRHPVLLGFALWAFAHMLVTGDVVGVTLFGGLGLFALAGFRIVDRRMKKRLGEKSWRAFARSFPTMPFLGVFRNHALPKFSRADFRGLMLGIMIVVILLLGGHRMIFGPDPLVFAFA